MPWDRFQIPGCPQLSLKANDISKETTVLLLRQMSFYLTIVLCVLMSINGFLFVMGSISIPFYLIFPFDGS